MISVQLLASCFTIPQNINTLTLPSGWYHRKDKADDNWLNKRLVSSLRQHTQWKHSPAFGHQARNNSAASLWPERDDTLSREALLAEQVSLNRLLRQKKDDRAAKESTDAKRRREIVLSGGDSKCRRFFFSRHQRRARRPKEPALSHRALQGLSSPQPEQLSPVKRVEQKNLLKISRSLQGYCWSLEPVLRSEYHPVFVQPIKDYVTKRWRAFRSRSRNQSSTRALSGSTGKRPEYQRAATSTSRDSIQLSRRTQIMTLIQGSGTSLGQPGPESEATLGAPTDRERILTSAEASPDCTQMTAISKPLTAIEHSDDDLPAESTEFSSSKE